MVVRYLRLRIKAFGLVSLFALFIVVDQAFTSMRLLGSASLWARALEILPIARDLQRPVSSILDLLISLFIAIALAMLLLWVLPSRRVAWQPLFPGALLIGSTLTILNFLLARILLAVGVRFQAYGLVGGCAFVESLGLVGWSHHLLRSMFVCRPGSAPARQDGCICPN